MGGLDFATLWNATRDTLRARLGEVAPIAAAFMFLPQLLLARMGGAIASEATPQAADALPLVVMMAVVIVSQMVAQLAITAMALGIGTGATVADILRASAARVVPGLVASLAQSLVIGLGLALAVASPLLRPAGLVLMLGPGVYLFARLSVAMAALVAEGGGPTEACRRSLVLTHGAGFRILGWLLLLVFGLLVASLIVSLFGTALGAMLKLALGTPASGWGASEWVGALVSTAAGTAMSVVLVVFAAMLYRALAAARPPAA